MVVAVENVWTGAGVQDVEVLGVHFESEAVVGHAVGPGREETQQVLEHGEGDPRILSGRLWRLVP